MGAGGGRAPCNIRSAPLGARESTPWGETGPGVVALKTGGLRLFELSPRADTLPCQAVAHWPLYTTGVTISWGPVRRLREGGVTAAVPLPPIERL